MISGILLSTLLQSSPIFKFLVGFPLGLLDILNRLPYSSPDLRWGLGVVLIGSLLVHAYIGSPSHYQGVGEAGGTQVDIQSEEKASLDCMTIYNLIRKLPDHVTLSGMWYGP